MVSLYLILRLPTHLVDIGIITSYRVISYRKGITWCILHENGVDMYNRIRAFRICNKFSGRFRIGGDMAG